MVLVGVFYEVLLLVHIIWDKCICVDESLDFHSFSLLGIMMDIMAQSHTFEKKSNTSTIFSYFDGTRYCYV